MKKITPAFVSFIVAAMLTPMTAAAQAPVTCDDPDVFNAPAELAANGHYYQAIPALNKSWEWAENAASSMTFDDPATPDTVEYYPGHLAIITTAAEDCFIEKLRYESFDTNGGRPEYWVGGIQDAGTAVSDENWHWIIPEAPFDNYVNWQDGEPNDAGAGEAYLGIGHTNVPGWNDEANVGNIGGFIVEFDVNAVVIENLEDCLAGPDGLGSCDTTPDGAQKITIPDAAVQNPNASVKSTTYRLTDDPDRCGIDALVLFGGDLIISPNHCATAQAGYEFIVVHTEAIGIELQEGTIRVVQDAQAALDLFPYSCDSSISPTTSPNEQEIVIYQRSDADYVPGPMRMREYGHTWGNSSDVSGATADITDSCGSSRGRRAENSWSVIGMVQYFGLGTDFETNRATNFRLWNELVIFKMQRLIEAIDASSPALRPNEYNQIHTQAQRALQKFTEASYSRATSHLDNLLRKVERASYDSSVTGENNQGEAIERAGAIKFMIEVKVAPFEAGSL